MNEQSKPPTSEPSLHRCGPLHSPVRVGEPVRRLPCKTIDVHCHLFTPGVEALVAGHPGKMAEAATGAAALGAEAASVNAAMMSSLLPRLTDIDTRLADMDAMGVDIQAVSPAPTQYYSWAEADLAQQIADQQNEAIEALCASHPQRFVGLGSVSLQHPSLAARQLETLMRKRGFKGVEISSRADDIDIADRRFDPFWAKADELGAVVFIHPWGTTLGTRLSSHYLMNTIGQPFETTVCLSKLIFGGTFDRFQRLKIIAAHGGGYLPLYAGRSNHARAVRPDASGCECQPGDYLQRIWYDSVVYDAESLERLIAAVGIRQVLLGTDYPFDMGHYDPASLVERLDSESQRLLLGGSAAELLNLSRAD